MTLRLVTVIAEAHGCEVISAVDGREAFRILQHDADFSAAIFDMMMPHLHGMDLIHYLKTDERLKRIPIGMITAEQDPKIWNESVAAGALVFLPKPFTPPQVQMMLRMLISKCAV
jgi:CheY-like chemotaxis protein